MSSRRVCCKASMTVGRGLGLGPVMCGVWSPSTSGKRSPRLSSRSARHHPFRQDNPSTNDQHQRETSAGQTSGGSIQTEKSRPFQMGRLFSCDLSYQGGGDGGRQRLPAIFFWLRRALQASQQRLWWMRLACCFRAPSGSVRIFSARRSRRSTSMRRFILRALSLCRPPFGFLPQFEPSQGPPCCSRWLCTGVHRLPRGLGRARTSSCQGNPAGARIRPG